MFSGERELWRKVLMQAVEDLFAKSSLEQRDAFVWIFEKNRDFQMVCDFAEISPRRVRECALSKIINGE